MIRVHVTAYHLLRIRVVREFRSDAEIAWWTVPPESRRPASETDLTGHSVNPARGQPVLDDRQEPGDLGMESIGLTHRDRAGYARLDRGARLGMRGEELRPLGEVGLDTTQQGPRTPRPGP